MFRKAVYVLLTDNSLKLFILDVRRPLKEPLDSWIRRVYLEGIDVSDIEELV